ncbi:hypothetical protein FIBSPDRAFT_1039204 [Athelia psychrophila]|uniref:Uncharacterized protein n=1 Tax=Athelia psychrophila TaxID=1759441 RepID=A0A166RZN3_9AGAM|nr:hypothetical protein FIBSPDRAFT_1039204 [Fibularhizoctonia sp. CBS 109695]
MKAPRRPFPSFSLAMSETLDSAGSHVPSERSSQVFRYQPYPRSRRVIDLDGRAMRTIDERFNEPTLNRTSTVRVPPICDNKQDADSAVTHLIHLHDAVHMAGKYRQGGSRARRLSMTTLVIDLALAVKRKMSKSHPSKA